MRSLKIGLVFPELDKHDIKYYRPILSKTKNDMDLIVFPEGFENVKTKTEIRPNKLLNNSKISNIVKKYQSICERYTVAIILGLSIDYSDRSVNAGGNDQYCFIFVPNKKIAYYHKHTTSKYKAFFDDGWTINNNFPIFKVKNIKIGVSICHDMFNALIPKLIKKKGSKIWVNISYQNVRPHIWESMLQTRSIENDFISLCTLHKNAKIPNQQKEPYAFSPEGKIRLRDLATNNLIDSMPLDNRTGKIYAFDTLNYQVSKLRDLEPINLSKNALVSALRLTNKKISCSDKNNFVLKKIGAIEFLYYPEKLWKLFFKSKNRIPIFIVLLNSQKQWLKLKDNISFILRGRIIEFSTLFLFLNKNTNYKYLCAYRSSSYKDTRLFYPEKFPIFFDKRYLKGISSTLKISQNDTRCIDEAELLKKMEIILDYLN